MQLSSIVSVVRVELQDQAGVMFPDADLITLATEAENEFCRETRIYEGKSQLSTVEGEWEYDLPADWISARLLLHADVNSGSTQWVRLEPTSLEKMAQEVPNFYSDDISLRGKPRRYWIDNQETLCIHPRPDVASTIQMFYIGTPPPFTALTDQIHIPTELSNAIKEYLMAKCYAKDQDVENETKHTNAWLVMIKKGHTWRNRRQMDARISIDAQSSVPFSGGSIGSDPQSWGK